MCLFRTAFVDSCHRYAVLILFSYLPWVSLARRSLHPRLNSCCPYRAVIWPDYDFLYTLLKKIDFSILRIGKNVFSVKKEWKKEAVWSEKRGNDNIVYGKDTY